MVESITSETETSASKKSKGNKWLRVFLPVLIILIWLTGAGFGGPMFGRVGEVSSNDQSAYLPSSAESTKVNEQAPEFYDSKDIPALLLIESNHGALSQTDMGEISELAQKLKDVTGIVEVSPVLPAEDKEAVQLFITVSADEKTATVVGAMRDIIAKDLGDGLVGYVTGPAGFSTDMLAAFSGVDGLLLAVALAAVLIILLIVYRSLLLPIVVLSTSLFALCVALLTVWWMAYSGLFLLSGQIQGVLFILVIGAATDYSLLYVSRYREELLKNPDKWDAAIKAWKGAVEPILASGGTVIAGLMCMLLSDLKSNSVLGPVASIGIVFSMLSALTLLPALLGLLGRSAFWPHIPHYTDGSHSEDEVNYEGIWGRTVLMVKRHSRLIWILTIVVLIAGAALAGGFKAEGVSISDLVMTQSQARDGQKALSKHFPDGSGNPVNIIVPKDDTARVVENISDNPGIDSISIISSESPSGQAPITSAGIKAFGPPGTPPPSPTVVDGRVLLQATLSSAPDSKEALETIKQLRKSLHDVAPGTLVGGTTATTLDTNIASVHDRNLIIPIILVVIMVILMLLLRAIVAPIMLILTTILSFGTAMGVSAVVFYKVLDLPGADAAVPLYGFVFLVALGIDYNIFLMTRVREESQKHGTEQGVIRGLAITGTVITSAGMVLAATFAALVVIPILFLVQLAFIVAFGVLLDTFIVRTLLVPALSLEIGEKIWWPSNMAREENTSEITLR